MIETIEKIQALEDKLNQLRRLLYSQLPCGKLALRADRKHPIHSAVRQAEIALEELKVKLGEWK